MDKLPKCFDIKHVEDKLIKRVGMLLFFDMIFITHTVENVVLHGTTIP